MKSMSTSNLEILSFEQTPLGMLCLRKRRALHDSEVTLTEITLNGEFLMSSYYTASERALATIALEMHDGQDVNVLVGGLGLGYTANEVLQSDWVQSVEVVELLPEVISWLDKELVPLAGELSSDKRVQIVEGDIYGRLAASSQQTFDVILIDVDHSPDERLDTKMGRFYTRGGLRAAKEHLAEDGILGVWSYAKDTPFVDALRDVFGDVRIESVSYNNQFLDNEEHTDWLFFVKK